MDDATHGGQAGRQLGLSPVFLSSVDRLSSTRRPWTGVRPQQPVIVAENEYEKSKLQLARAIGLPLGQPFTLADAIPYAPMQTIALDDALKRVEDLGGTVIHPGERWAICKDSEGSPFALTRAEARQQAVEPQ